MPPLSRARGAWLVAIALGGAGGGVLALRRAHRATTDTPVVAAASTSVEAARRFRLGEQRRWSLSFEARMLQQRTGTAPVNMTLTGQWLTTVVGARQTEYDVACEIAAAKVVGGGVEGVRPEDVTALERRMARRFYVTYRADGAALRASFPKDVDPGTRNLLQTIATDTQLVRPAQPVRHWTTVERDGAGGYLASYLETAPGAITKTKLKYLDADGTAGAAHGGIDVVIDQSIRHLTVDAGGALVTFEGGDTTRIALPMGGGGISMRVSTRLTDLHVGRAEDLVGALERSRAELDSGPLVTWAPSEEETRLRHDRELVEGARFDDVLRAVAKPEGDREAQDHARAQLAAWLRLHPESVAPTARAAHDATPGPAAKALTATLGQAGSPVAQAALCALARADALVSQVRTDALVGIMFLDKPTTETTRDVRALLDAPDPAVRQAARYTAGTLARTLRATVTADADALDGELAKREAIAKGDARVELLAAMGNSAAPALLPPLQAALTDPAPSVRTAAARALRLYADDATKALLAKTIVQDADGPVRAAAIFAATFNGAFAPYEDALTTVALHDPVEFVRANAVTELARHPDATAKTLEQVAANDPKPGIRRIARAALDRAAR